MSRTGTYYIETWGCQMNVLDSERMAGRLGRLGYEPAASAGEADILLLNTCNVREKAETKVYSELGRFRDWKKHRPGRVIGVAGCVAQHAGTRILDHLPFVDFVLGTGNVEKLGDAIEAARAGERTGILEFPSDAPQYQFEAIRRSSPFQAHVTVIEGCNQYCTFCVVPFTRGRERSRRACEIRAEVEDLARRGYREVTLLGQTVNAYACPETGTTLAGLLRDLSKVDGVERLRFLTSHPAFVTDDLIDAMAESPKIANYFHLPAQSGSDAVLFRMKRRYTAARYREIVASIRRRVPQMAISSDFIVGFPGETEEDFLATLALLEDVRFANVFAFIYSERPGTAAARWGAESRVESEVASRRLERLFDRQREIQRRLNSELEGRVLPVLVEREGRAAGTWEGRTPCNRIVHVEDALAPGAIVNVRIQRAQPHCLIGSLA